MPFTVRKAAVEDAAPIRAVNRAAWRKGYADILSAEELARLEAGDTGYTVDDYRKGIAAEDTLCLVAVDDAIIGYCTVTRGADRDYVGSEERHLKALYVHPDHWRRGVGSALLAEAVACIDAPRLKTEVLQENGRGIAFYEAQGFEEVSEASIGPDAVQTLLRSYPTIILEKELDDLS